MLDLSDLKEKTVDELREIASTMDVAGYSNLKKFDLCMKILKTQSEQDGNKYQYGVLDVQAEHAEPYIEAAIWITLHLSRSPPFQWPSRPVQPHHAGARTT